MTLIDQFSATADLLPEPMILVSVDATIESANAAFLHVFGWTPSDLRRRSLLEFLAADGPRIHGYLRHCAASRHLLEGAMEVRNRDGGLVACRTEGGLFRSGSSEGDPLVLLRVVPEQQGATRFVALTHKISELGAELTRRRAAEESAIAALQQQRNLDDRLRILTETSGTLFASLSTSDALAEICAMAERLFRGDAFAAWRHEPGTRDWRIVWQKNLSDQFVSLAGELAAPARQPARLTDPLLISHVDTAAALADGRLAYHTEGVKSLVIIPLQFAQRTRAMIVAYYRRTVEFDETDLRVADALANLGSSALASSALTNAQTRGRQAAEAAERRASLLAKAGAALATSLDYEELLSTIVHLAVPDIAEWCAVDIVSERGELRRLAVAHLDSARIEFEHPPQEPPDAETRNPISQVIRDRTAIILNDLGDQWLRALARDDRQLELLRTLGLVSCMCVPLAVGERAIGALTFASSRAGGYEGADLQFAQDFSARAAQAIENARAYEEVRRTNRLKDDFLATLSHELRTPLNAVLGYVQLLRTGALPPEKHASAFETIENNASSLRKLIEDVLDVSRIEAGKIRLNMRALDSCAVIKAAVATIAPTADAKGVRLDLVIDPYLPALSGDPDRLKQIVWNLLSNAVKFTGRGGRVQVQLVLSGANLEIEVSDTGAGISGEFLPYVFERFLQADTHFGREGGGLGLGLAITRHLVELHGGSIRALSAGPGQGTTFTVVLPLAGVPEEPELDHVVIETADVPTPQALGDLSSIRVLAVDDDTDHLARLRQVLESAGAHVSTASSGRHALEVLEAGATDVLVTELAMSEMDGFELVAVVRTFADPRVSGLPAVALTTSAAPADRLQVLKGGFQAQLSKPIHPADLTAAVLTLARRAAQASNP